MSTTNYNVGDTYVEVSTADNVVVNKSSYVVRVHYGDSAPADDTEDFIPLKDGLGIIKSNDLPAGNTYVRTEDGQTSDVAVSE